MKSGLPTASAYVPRGTCSPPCATWHVRTILALLLSVSISAYRVEARPIPLQESLEYLDGPDPHGPGDVLVDHQPHNFSGPASDTMAFEIPGGSIVAQWVADDFILPASEPIAKVKFWGFYNSQILPTGTEIIQINFHAPRPLDGLPGEIIHSEAFANPMREWTGRHVLSANGGLEYIFEVDLSTPFLVQAGITTWISIFQVGDPTSTFRWEHSVNGDPNGHAFNNQFVGDWTFAHWPQGGNTAFQLMTPEPGSVGYMFIASVVLAIRRRGRRR